MKSKIKSKLKNRLIKLSLVLLLLIIGVGYAILSQNLNINGYSKLFSSTWNIHFDNVQVKSGSVSIDEEDDYQMGATIDTNDNTKVSYSIVLSKPGDFYEFNVDAVNSGSIDGMVDLTASTLKIDNKDPIDISNGNLPNYLKYSVTYLDGGQILKDHILKSNDRETYKIRVEFKKDINNSDLPNEDITLSFDYDVNYIQANDKAKEVPDYVECTYDGELIQGAEYVNGQYTYRYMQEHNGTTWSNIDNDGWGVILTDKESIDPVTSKLCSIINEKPLVSMKSMFKNSKTTSIDTSNFLTSNVVNMDDMFSNATNLESIDLKSFDTRNVTGMNTMFANNTKIVTLDLSNFDTLKVTGLSGLFSGCTNLKQVNMDNFDITKSGSSGGIFNNTPSLEFVSMKNWIIGETSPNGFGWSWSAGSSPLKTLDVTGWDLSITKTLNVFAGLGSLKTIIGLDTWDTSNVTNMSSLFQYCSSIESVNVSSFNTGNVTNMGNMFNGCSSLKEMDLSTFNTSNVANVSAMFSGTTKLEDVNLDNWDVTKCANSGGVFGGSGVTNVSARNWKIPETYTHWISRSWSASNVETLDVTGWDLTNTTNIQGLFGSSSKLVNLIGLDTWDTSNITNMSNLFNGCNSLKKLDLSSWNTSNVVDMSAMFSSLSNIEEIDLTNIDTSNVTNMVNMFSVSPNLKTIYANNSFVVTKLTEEGSSDDMFKDSNNIIGGAGTVYNSEKIDKEYAHMDGGETNPGYFSERSSIKVTFDTNGGVISNRNKYYDVGDSLGELPIPNKNHSIFLGWYTDIDGGIKIDENTVVNNNVTYYAHWRNSNLYTIKFNPNEGIVYEVERTIYEGKKIGTLPTPMRDGYLFSGWFTEKNNGTKIDENTIIRSNATYYAHWKIPEMLTITFNPNFEGLENVTREVLEASIIGELPVFEDDNYKVIGWYTGIMDGVQISSNTIATSSCTYYARWQEKEAVFDEGTRVNAKMKNIANNTTNMTADSQDSKIKSFVRANELPSGFVANSNNTVSSNKSDYPIYIWFNTTNGILYYYCEKDVIYLNSYSSYMFSNFRKIESMPRISELNTSKVTNMFSMFDYSGSNVSKFKIDLSGWDTSKVTNMSGMFSFAGNLSNEWSLGDLSEWNTSKVTNMSCMFYETGYNTETWSVGDLSRWDVSKVTNMNGMFSGTGARATTWSIGNISGWKTSKVTNMSLMFYNAGSSTTTFSLNLSGWDTSNVNDMNSMFSYAGASSQTFILNLSGWNTSKVTNMRGMFYIAGSNASTFNILGLSDWNTSNVTDMSNMFYYAGYDASVFNFDLSGWKTSKVTNMKSMFYFAGRNATTWSIGDLSEWNTSQVTNMYQMFEYAGHTTTTFDIGDLSEWDTSKVTNMSRMFCGAAYYSTTFNLDISKWNTSQVTDMTDMFTNVGRNSTTWSITIPRTNGGGINNTTTALYGSTTSIYASPSSGRQFTLASN